jgi:hypothetical protein
MELEMPNKIEIVSPDEADEAECVICIPLTYPMTYPDNMVGECSRCGAALQHRPHIPNAPLVCVPCITPELLEQQAKGDLVVQITPKTAAEVEEYLRKKNAH